MQTNSQAEPKQDRKKSSSQVVTVLIVILLIPAAVLAIGILREDMRIAEASMISQYSEEFLTSAISADSPAPPPEAAFPHIVYEDGRLFVRGVASSEERVADTVEQLEEVFGPGQIVPEFALDPDFVPNPNQATEVYFADNVLFRSGSAAIEPEFLDVLGISAQFLQLSEQTTITITGHTDSAGDEVSNLELSQARVDAARQAMIDRGGDAGRITAIGKGETEPIADNSTAEGRQQNRRVELTITP